MDQIADKTFDDFFLSDEMLRALSEIDYKHPTEVQARTIPLILAGIDLIVQSETGSGKTAAFAIPILEMLEPDPGTIEVLVLAPTRELAKQVCKEFDRLGKFKSLESTSIYGGVSYGPQIEAVQSAQVVSATPGRLLDLAKQRKIDLSTLRLLVLDEADEMLSMGFEKELQAILEFLPEERQSLLYSATVTEEIKHLAKNMLFHPEYIQISDDSLASASVSHEYYAVGGVERMRELLRVLQYEQPPNAIIFANTRAQTFQATEYLKKHGYRAEVINGDLPQKEREKTLEALREGRIDYLIATDVAARGIDISDLSHVINLVIPESPEVYVHRTGRTGRAGRSGKAISLVSPREMATMVQTEKTFNLKLAPQKMPRPEQIRERMEAKALKEVAERLRQNRSIKYGRKLGIAKALVNGSLEAEEQMRLVARLLALADDVSKGSYKAAAAAPEERAVAPTRPADKAETAEKAPEKTPETNERKSGSKRSSKRSSRRGSDRNKSRKSSGRKSSGRSSSGGSSGRSRARGAKKDQVEEIDNSGDETVSSASDTQKAAETGASRRGKSSGRRSSRSSKSKNGGSSRNQKKRSSSSNRRQSKPTKPSSEELSIPVESTPDQGKMKRMWVNVGNDRIDDSKKFLEFLIFTSGMGPEDFGKLQVERTYSYVEVREDYLRDIISAVSEQDWDGQKITAEPARN